MSTPTPTRTPRPASRLPRAPLTPRERAGEVVRGLVAAAVLLAVLAGVPWALVELVGNPLPTTTPAPGWLDAELSASAVLDVLAVVLWALWGHFVVCVLAEFRAWAVGARSGTVPFGGANQLFAQRLVAAVLLLAAGAVWVPGTVTAVSAVPVAATAAVAAAGAEAGAARSAPAPVQSRELADLTDPADPADLVDATGAPTAPDALAGTVTYVVHPPQGRYHDCLWDIAERTLGDPLRYREIFALNQDRVQADGSRLVDADLIRPGWVLLLPADAVGGQAGVRAPAVRPAAPAVDPGWAPTAPEATSAAASPPAGAEVRAEVRADAGARAVLSGGLLFAGVLVALRRPGTAPGAAEPDLPGADPALAGFLDRALRQVAAGRTGAGLPLPEVVAAHLSADDLVLHLGTHLSGAAAEPPAPWTVLPGGAWRVARADLPDGDVPDVAAPYPALVDVAVSGDHEILLDLESAPGIVAIGGDGDVARDVVTSMVVELATNSWSDGVDVHLVGFGDDLSVLSPGTVRSHARLDAVLDQLEREPRPVGDDLLAGRADRAPDRARPVVVAVSGTPTEEQAQRLHALTSTGRTPVAVVCVGDLPGASWRFAVDRAGHLDLGVLGLRGTARRLTREQYEPWLAGLQNP